MSDAPQPASPRKLAVLVVEDDKHACDLFELCLSKRGHSVVTASTGRQAIRLLDAQRFDAIVADVLLPDSDGIDVLNHIRETKKDLRVVAVSGGGKYVSSIYCRDLALATGAHAALLKPFKGDALIAAVEAA
jgi:DNA-binding response OmpR family regulator